MPEDDTKKLEAEGIKSIYYPLNRRSVNPLRGLLTIYSLYRIFHRERFLAIHTFTIKPNIYGAIAARLAGIPIVIIQVTGLGYVYTADTLKARLLRLFSDLLYKLIFRIATRVIFQNKNDLAVMSRILDADKAVIIKGSGVDTNYYSISNADKNKINDLTIELGLSGRIVVTLIARLYWSKGIKEFVDAANLVHNKFKDVLFLVIGWQDQGNPEVVPDEFIKKYSCDFIRFLGWREDIRELLSITDIYVLPSYGEGLPHSILEAMSMGKPVVTTEVPGCRDVVENGLNGLLVPVKNSSKLANAIVELVLDETLRNKFGSKGRERALKLFSNEIILREVLSLYSSLIPQVKNKDDFLIRNATFADCLSIAKIHKELLPESFLGSLGLKFLTLLYRELLKYKNGVILVSEKDATLCGFIAGIINAKCFNSYFFRNNFIKLVFILFPKFFNLRVLRKIFEDLAYSKHKWGDSIPEAELLSIAVNADFYNKGIGRQLFEGLVNEFKSRGINEFKILVGQGLKGSESFYQKMGCQRVRGFKLHNNAESSIYVFKGR